MIGKLTIDKSSMNISYFLYSLILTNNAGGRISRKEFTEKMALFVGVPSTKNGKENRTGYNKTKMPRYFGFLDIAISDGTNDLLITNRGKECIKYIKDNGEDIKSDIRYEINKKYIENFRDLIFNSVLFDSFGRNNNGAEQSYTDVEPPKIVFKAIKDLGKVTIDEICFIIYGMNLGLFDDYDIAISKVKENRAYFHNDYKNIFEDWKITNIVNDCKIVNIFLDENIGLLNQYIEKETDKVFYCFSEHMTSEKIANISAISAIYKPLMLKLVSDNKYKNTEKWLNTSILGKLSDNELVELCDLHYSKVCSNETDAFEPLCLEKALLKALTYPKQNVYLIVECNEIRDFMKQAHRFVPLFDRINELKSINHGWSIRDITHNDLYRYLISKNRNIKNIFNDNKIKFPPNLHIIVIEEGE